MRLGTVLGPGSRVSVLAAGVLLAAFIPASGVVSAAGMTRYVSPSGTDNATCDSSHPCRHVQYAVTVALPGDTVKIAAGTYVEQVSIAKNLTVVGAGIDTTTIKGPDTKTFDTTYPTNTYIVETTGPVTVYATALTVAGPSGPGGGLNCGPNPLSLDMGVAVLNGSTLNMWSAAVRNIYDIDAMGNENSGCQRGTAISVGRPGGQVAPNVGHANLSNVSVTIYQKNGVAVRSAGSTLNLSSSQVENTPSAVIASNGVEVLDAATGQISGNSVSGNQCNLGLGTICGPGDPLNLTEAAGILTFGATPSTLVAGNNVFANDMGIYTDDAITIRRNLDSGNRAVGIYVDTDATKLHVTQNTTNSDGPYGIAIGPCVAAFGCTSANKGGNFFIENTAFNNTKYDLYQSTDAGPNFNQDNHCLTALPSRTYWDCENGDEDDNSDADVVDNGGGEGDQHGGGEHRPPASWDD